MASLSVKQKTLIFLNKYKSLNPNDIYNTPWEVTQDGVANALCISRAHACIVLNQLRDEGNADEKISHVKNGKSKRKAYYLTPAGIMEADKLMEYVIKECIDIDSILNAKKKKAEVILNKLSKDDRYALGCACAFNMPMKKSDLPPIVNASIPTDVDDRVIIDADLRNDILRSGDEEERRSWHAYAANYWFERKLERGDDFNVSIQELLYHYVESGRNRDACKLINNELYHFINNIGDFLHDTAKRVVPSDGFEKSVLILDIEVCLEYGEIDEAEKYAKDLTAIDSDCASAYYYDIAMKKGDKATAKAAIADTWERYPMAAIRWASLLREEGKYQEAREVLETNRNIVDTDLNNYQLEKYLELAKLDIAEGHSQDAFQRIYKARSTVNTAVYDKRFNAMEKDLRKRLGI